MATFILGMATFFRIGHIFLETRKLENGHILVPHQFRSFNYSAQILLVEVKSVNFELILKFADMFPLENITWKFLRLEIIWDTKEFQGGFDWVFPNHLHS